MRVKFKKLTRDKYEQTKKWEFYYQCVDRPEFTVCAKGFEWATGLSEVKCDEIVEVEIKPVSRTCQRCHGTGVEVES